MFIGPEFLGDMIKEWVAEVHILREDDFPPTKNEKDRILYRFLCLACGCTCEVQFNEANLSLEVPESCVEDRDILRSTPVALINGSQ